MKALVFCLTAVACAMVAVAADARPDRHHRHTNVILVPPGGFGASGAPGGAGDVASPGGSLVVPPGGYGISGALGGAGDVANPSGGIVVPAGGFGFGSPGGAGDVANPGSGAGDVAGGGAGDVANSSHTHHRFTGLTGTAGRSFGQLSPGSSGKAIGAAGGHSGTHRHVIAPAPHGPPRTPTGRRPS